MKRGLALYLIGAAFCGWAWADPRGVRESARRNKRMVPSWPPPIQPEMTPEFPTEPPCKEEPMVPSPLDEDEGEEGQEGA